MSLMTIGIAYIIVVLAGLLLIAELRTGYDHRRLRERSSEVFSVSDDVHGANFIGLPIDTGGGYGGSCGISGQGNGGGCDGAGHGA